jgi:single-strand DNA-binding protein
MVNKVMLVGNLASDPEVRASQSGTYVTTLRLATNVYAGKSEDGTRKEHTDFHNVVFFGKQAEVAGAHLHKGQLVYIEGRLHTSSWDDATSGTKKYKTEVIVDEFTFLGPKGQQAAA